MSEGLADIFAISESKLDETFINDVKYTPFSMCDIFYDHDDRLWSFNKLLSDVIDKNASVKKKIIKKPSVLYMNSRLRQAIHKKNMLYNAYRKGKVKWDVYRKQRNLATAIKTNNQKWPIFAKDVMGGPKTNRFGGQLNLLCPINPRLVEIRLFFRKGTR